ncbi:MAG: hypothetical protein V4536_01965 [Pseudomonadota bacterium]
MLSLIQRPPSPLEKFTKFRIVPGSHYISPAYKDKTPTIASEGFLILVGRARFELATNGLKDAQ